MGNEGTWAKLKDRLFDWLLNWTPSPQELERREAAMRKVLDAAQKGHDDLWQEIRGAINTAWQAGLTEAGKERTSSAANARWARLGPVKQWAFDQRAAQPNGSRAALIRSIAPQVRSMAREAGEPLTGDNQAVIDTVTRWFREAKIR